MPKNPLSPLPSKIWLVTPTSAPLKTPPAQQKKNPPKTISNIWLVKTSLVLSSKQLKNPIFFQYLVGGLDPKCGWWSCFFHFQNMVGETQFSISNIWLVNYFFSFPKCGWWELNSHFQDLVLMPSFSFPKFYLQIQNSLWQIKSFTRSSQTFQILFKSLFWWIPHIFNFNSIQFTLSCSKAKIFLGIRWKISNFF